MRKLTVAGAIVALAGIGLVMAPTAGAATESAGKDDNGSDRTTMAIFGDSPYGLNPTDDSQVTLTPAFISQINADPAVRSVAFVGDIHSGKSFCTVAYDTTVANLWQGFADPLVYTPGDNEWSDCHKKAEGGGTYNPATGAIDFVPNGSYAGGNPIDNLALVRSTFFGKPGKTLGSGKLEVTSQAKAYDRRFPTDKNYVENVRWTNKDVVFVTLNIPGGSNNDADPWYGAPSASQAQLDEVAQRTAADLRWLAAAFAEAKDERAKAVVILEQADMWDLDGKTADHLTGYEPFVAAIAAHTTAFGKPVMLFNGDSHKYRSDNPYSASTPCLTESATGEVACTENLGLHPGYVVPNFHRVVVHGSTSPLEWLKLTIDTEHKPLAGVNTFGPFSWSRQNTGLVGAS